MFLIILSNTKENEKDYKQIKKEHEHLFDDNFKVIIVEHIYELLTNPNIILDIKVTQGLPKVSTSVARRLNRFGCIQVIPEPK